ncbi:MAG: GAF domain-containing protein [Deltaproteobacteria bacterium]|nr:GAF domain-containing protein [Deltaproteobacteria bacterium]
MEKETSCINARAILEYVRTHNSGDVSGLLGDLDPELDQSPDTEGFLTDPNNWISCSVISKLYERAKKILKDDAAAYKIARHAVENLKMGYAQSIIVKALWSSRKAVKHAQKLNDKFNRNKRVEVVQNRGNEALVRLHWNTRMKVTKDICLNNQGVYTFMPLIWGGKPLTLHEKCCFFEGAPYCEYHLKWSFRNRFHEILSSLFTSKSVLMEIIAEMEEDKQVIERKYEEVNRLNSELDRKIKQLIAMQETGKAILSILDLEALLTVILNLLNDACQIHRALIMLVNEKEKCLEFSHAVGFSEAVPEAVKKYRVPLGKLGNMLARVASTGKPEYIPEVKAAGLREGNALLTYGRPSSIYVVPLITRSRVIGVIATDAVGQAGVPEETRETLRIFAPQVAIAIENARLYKTLQEQMEEVKRSHALLSRAEKFSFLGNLSARLAHEIKNPMTAIGTFIQLLPQKYDDEEFRNSFYKIAMEETNRVNNLITELLDLVKTRESHFEWGDLHDLIEKMVLLVSPQTKAKKIEVTLRFDPRAGRFWMDTEKMKQVILNLLSNAAEFSPERGKIAIRTQMREGPKGGGSLRVEIADNGIGIHPSIVDKIFDPYFTTKHKSSMHNGTGLGLFIAHQSVQDHGGTIEVKSRLEQGTTFIVTLPVAPSPDDEERFHHFS